MMENRKTFGKKGYGMLRLFLGIDVGTSGTKALLIDETGGILASHTEEYPLYSKFPTWSEQDPEDWWKATCLSARQVLQKSGCAPDAVAGVGFSGQMHGMVALDEQMNVVRPAILWNDSRTVAQCERITQVAGGLDGLLSMTNNQMLPGYTGGKIEWMKQEEPENYARTRLILNPKDYIRYRLTGEVATEVSDASGTGLFDVKNRRFHDELIAKLGYPRSWFPKCLESHEVAGKVTQAAAAETGLPVGVPVVAGGGDAVLQTTTTGLDKPGVLGLVLGTSGVVAMGLDGYASGDGTLQMFCNIAPNMWHAMGCVISAGASYRWCRDVLGEPELDCAKAQGISAYPGLNALAASAQPGSGGIFFVPYLMGERCPYSDPNARGGFIGLTNTSTRADMVRSVMEGVTFAMRDVGDRALALGGAQPQAIILSGGGASSALWRSICADVFGIPVRTVCGSAEGGAFGAALLAGVGTGAYANLAQALGVLKDETLTEPGENQRRYNEAFGVYRMLYGALKPAYDAMAKL